MKDLRKIIYISLLTTIALVLSIIESMIPIPVPIPGARLGLSNLVILSTLVVFGFSYALTVGILKSLLLVLITGSVTSVFYSLTGSIISIFVMAMAYRYLSKYLSLIGVSVLGSVAHNFSQVLVGSLILNNFKLFLYLPVLMIVGLFTGIFVGISSTYVSKHLRLVLKKELR